MPNNGGHDLTHTANFIIAVHAAFWGLSKCINVLKVLTLFPKTTLFHRNHTLNCGSSRPLCENGLICESHKPELHHIGGPRAARAELRNRVGWFGWEGAFSPFPARCLHCPHSRAAAGSLRALPQSCVPHPSGHGVLRAPAALPQSSAPPRYHSSSSGLH